MSAMATAPAILLQTTLVAAADPTSSDRVLVSSGAVYSFGDHNILLPKGTGMIRKQEMNRGDNEPEN